MDLRTRILEGAARAFGELGYAATRVEDILVAAEVSRPTFYKVFSSKEDVFETLSAMHHARALELLSAALASTDRDPERLETIVDAFLRWRAGLGPLGRVLDAETRSPYSGLTRHRELGLRALAEQWMGELEVLGRPSADPLIFAALIAAAERVADSLPFDREIREEDIARRKAVLLRIVSATISTDGERPAPMPSRPAPEPPAARATARRSSSAARARPASPRRSRS